MTVSAIIVAGGKGVRMGHHLRKQYVALGDRPILSHTVGVFTACDLVHDIILVIPHGDAEYCKTDVLPHVKNAGKVKLVSGGAERQDSVYSGLMAVEDRDGIVLIHDGVRPFVREDFIKALIDGAEKEGACIPGIPAFDTLKKVNRFGMIDGTAERQGLHLAQTPQAFQYPLIRKAHDAAKDENFSGTDDASLAERLGFPVRVIQGRLDNIKITTKEDLKLANAILFSGFD
ncbi:MAG: 2-C-methyl-D-erythritol 4-phosphate cytidylyltransferase [Desulfobacterales bacterium]